MDVRRLACLVVVIGLGLPGALVAGGAKTDVVVLKNGDRITGEITKLERGRLEVSTDDLSTVNIEWDKIAAVTSSLLFEVEISSGQRFYGSLAPGDPGQLAIVGSHGRAVFDLLAIVRIARIRRTFWNRLDGNIGAGGSYTQSSGVAQASLNLLVGAKKPAFEWKTSFDTTVTIKEGEPDSSRFTGEVAYTRLLRNRWLVPGGLTIEQNQDQGYTLRATVTGGLGRRLVHSNRTVLAVGAGLAANREVPVDGPTVTNIEARFTFDFLFFTYQYPKTNLSVQLTGFPSLSDSGRFRFNSDISISRDLFTKDFYIAFTLYDDFDSRPPTAEASKNDVGATFSLGWKF